MAKTFGLAVEVLSPQDIAGMYPLLNLDSVTGGVFLPKDGQADPANITHALAKAARQNGVAIVEHCTVTGIAQANGRVTGVETEPGSIAAATVVTCARLWGRHGGLMAGPPGPPPACPPLSR